MQVHAKIPSCQKCMATKQAAVNFDVHQYQADNTSGLETLQTTEMLAVRSAWATKQAAVTFDVQVAGQQDGAGGVGSLAGLLYPLILKLPLFKRNLHSSQPISTEEIIGVIFLIFLYLHALACKKRQGAFCRQAALKAATFLSLVGLARSEHDPIKPWARSSVSIPPLTSRGHIYNKNQELRGGWPHLLQVVFEALEGFECHGGGLQGGEAFCEDGCHVCSGDVAIVRDSQQQLKRQLMIVQACRLRHQACPQPARMCQHLIVWVTYYSVVQCAIVW